MRDCRQDPRTLPLGHLLAQVSRLVGRRMRTRMEEIGFHRAQGFILLFLWQHDGTPQSTLAQALHITPATATKTLQRMERDGWIARQRDEEDQRIVRVCLTAKAHSLLGELRRSLDALDAEVSSALTKTEAEGLRESLVKIHRHLEGNGELS